LLSHPPKVLAALCGALIRVRCGGNPLPCISCPIHSLCSAAAPQYSGARSGSLGTPRPRQTRSAQ
jgi:hypothetical protein